MDTEVRFQNPPNRNAARVKTKWGQAYMDEADALRARPGEWGIVQTYPKSLYGAAKSLYTRIQTGRYRSFQPAAEWDATIATEEDAAGNAVVNVYAIYLGRG